MKDNFLLYKLIRDVYSMWPCFYSLSKGEKDGLPKYKRHWNFIQSNTKMSKERVFWNIERQIENSTKEYKHSIMPHVNLVMASICLYNMCISNLDGFDMDQVLEVQKDAQIEANTTLGNFKRVDIFWVVEKVIKQMKRLQNLRMVDGDDRNDIKNMKDMKHQGEDEDPVLTTMENNPTKKAKARKTKRILIELMAI